MADEERDGVELTHLDQPLGDGSDATKRELIDYLDAMADRLVPVLADRPLSVIRVRPGQPRFMQKNLPKYAPDWIPRCPLGRAIEREVTYPLCDDRRTLLWLGNQRAVEFHAALFRTADEGRPTHLIMDIDPPEGSGFEVAVAPPISCTRRSTRRVARCGEDERSQGRACVRPDRGRRRRARRGSDPALAARAERHRPAARHHRVRGRGARGKVFLDATRAGGATVAAAYSPRLRHGLPVSFPLSWDALDALTRTRSRSAPRRSCWGHRPVGRTHARSRSASTTPRRGRASDTSRAGAGHARRQAARGGAA